MRRNGETAHQMSRQENSEISQRTHTPPHTYNKLVTSGELWSYVASHVQAGSVAASSFSAIHQRRSVGLCMYVAACMSAVLAGCRHVALSTFAYMHQ